MTQADIIIVGASARAAAFSALRAGFSPYWIDQFGDLDLAGRLPGACVAAGRYPGGIVELAAAALPEVPFIYTGAMENHPDVLRRLAASRPLLGNDAETCAAVRDPFSLRACLAASGIATADIRKGTDPVPPGRWLRKPLSGGGGLGIEPAGGGDAPLSTTYLQQFVEGESCAAVFVADGTEAALIGVTLQLVGRAEFHAPPFAYCGSVGPLPLAGGERDQWLAIGTALAREFGLRGLFGVDAIRSHDIVPIEVNPRYTASVEVHELAGGPATLALHAAACRGALPRFRIPAAGRLAAKAHLFASAELRIRDGLDPRTAVPNASVEFADIPVPGSLVRAGAPIMTILIRGDDEGGCARLLASTARGLYRALA